MKHVLLFLFIALSYSGHVFAQEASDLDLFEKNEFISSSGEILPYRFLTPKDFDSTKKYPLVVFLHGAGERGEDNEAQLKYGVGIFLKESNREKYPCFVVAPQCPKEGYWASAKFTRESYPIQFDYNYSYPITPALDAAVELVQDLISEKSIDASRVYITGLSMGGMGTFEAVGRFPSLFAAAVPVCGGGDVTAYNAEQAKVPFWIFHGDADAVVPVENSRKMYQRLLSQGAKVIYKEYPGVNHNSWENAYVEVSLLPWLFSKRKDEK